MYTFLHSGLDMLCGIRLFVRLSWGAQEQLPGKLELSRETEDDAAKATLGKEMLTRTRGSNHLVIHYTFNYRS